MDQDDRQGESGRRFRFRLRRRWIFAAVMLALMVPFGINAWDRAKAIRLAGSMASGAAYNLASVRFLGEDWSPAERDPRIVATIVEDPPRSGRYAGYRHAVHVEVALEWRPTFPKLAPIPYPVRGRATAAVLRTARGQWMPVLVE